MTTSHVPGLLDLCQPLGGLTGQVIDWRAQGDEPRLMVRMARTGDLSQIFTRTYGMKAGHGAVGIGIGLDSSETTLPALGEALERYCTSAFTDDQFITAAAEELGDDALDLETIPVCSATELSHARCPLIAPDKKAPIRWVRGVSLLDGRLVYVPVVMAYVHAGCASQAERFWFQISTGCAAHVSYQRALTSAIFEVMERDAISISWLQKLPLPRIEIDSLPAALVPYWDCYQRSSRELEYFFFDATTDMGVPTVYGVQVARANKRLMTVVGCSTALHPATAIIKVLGDLVSCSMFLSGAKPEPESWDDFTALTHGGTYMGRAEQAHAFDFLLQSNQGRRLSEITPFAGPGNSLQAALNVLRAKGLDAYAVDLSTDEALWSGMRVVRVLIPGLQPVGFQYRARYLGHARLYDAPKQMGYPVHKETELNHWPQPFC